MAFRFLSVFASIILLLVLVDASYYAQSAYPEASYASSKPKITFRVITHNQHFTMQIKKSHFSPYDIFVKFCKKVLTDPVAISRLGGLMAEPLLEKSDCLDPRTLERFRSKMRWRIGTKDYTIYDDNLLPTDGLSEPVDVRLSGIGVGGVQRGSEVDNFLYPWIVGIHRKPDADGKADPFCTGTLLSPTWVITAAHCFQDDNTPVRLRGYRYDVPKFNNFHQNYMSTFYVSSGRNDLDRSVKVEESERQQSSAGQNRPDGIIKTSYSQVLFVHIHPLYVYQGNHDLALVKLATPLSDARLNLKSDRDREIYAAAFPKIARYEDIVLLLQSRIGGRVPRLTQAGFGLITAPYKETFFGPTTDYSVSGAPLRRGVQLNMPTTKLHKTRSKIAKCDVEGREGSENLCTIDSENFSAMSAGDSGGPLFFWINRQVYLIGVAESAIMKSYEDGSKSSLTNPERPQIWTNVYEHLDFIKGKTPFLEMRVVEKDVQYIDFTEEEQQDLTIDGEVYVHHDEIVKGEDMKDKVVHFEHPVDGTFKSLCDWFRLDRVVFDRMI